MNNAGKLPIVICPRGRWPSCEALNSTEGSILGEKVGISTKQIEIGGDASVYLYGN